jgi:hypothetical protein
MVSTRSVNINVLRRAHHQLSSRQLLGVNMAFAIAQLSDNVHRLDPVNACKTVQRAFHTRLTIRSIYLDNTELFHEVGM